MSLESVLDPILEGIVIDASFNKLSTVLSTLNIVELGGNGYLIVLLCRDVYATCPAEVLAGYRNAKMVVVGSGPSMNSPAPADALLREPGGRGRPSEAVAT